MKNLIIIILFFVCRLDCLAQFGYAYGNSGYNYGSSACTTKVDSGFFLLGNSGWYSNGNLDFFLIKTDSLGKIKWAKNYGTDGVESSTDIINQGDSVFYLCGYTNKSITGDYNFKFVKIDNQGNLLLDKQFGTDSWDISTKSILINDSTLLFSGQSYYKLNNNGDSYLLKVNTKGDTLKSVNWGNSSEERFNNVDFRYDYISAPGYVKTADNIKKALLVKFDINLNPIDTFIYSTNTGFDCEFISAKMLNNKNTLAIGYYKSVNGITNGIRCMLDSNYNQLFIDTMTFNDDQYWETFTELNNDDILCVGPTKVFGNGNYGFYDVNVQLSNNGLVFKSGKTYGGVYEDTPKQIVSINDSLFGIIGSTNNFGPAYSHVFFIKFNINNYFINPEQFLIGQKESEKAVIKIFPNPSTKSISLTGSIENSDYKIYNVHGQLIKSGSIGKTNSIINVSDFSAGYYLFELNLQGEILYTKFIKE